MGVGAGMRDLMREMERRGGWDALEGVALSRGVVPRLLWVLATAHGGSSFERSFDAWLAYEVELTREGAGPDPCREAAERLGAVFGLAATLYESQRSDVPWGPGRGVDAVSAEETEAYAEAYHWLGETWGPVMHETVYETMRAIMGAGVPKVPSGSSPGVARYLRLRNREV